MQIRGFFIIPNILLFLLTVWSGSRVCESEHYYIDLYCTFGALGINVHQ